MEHGEVHVRPPAELQGQVGDPFFGNRLNPAQPGRAADGRLQGLGDERLDLLGGDPAVLGHNRQARIADLGQEVDAELP